MPTIRDIINLASIFVLNLLFNWIFFEIFGLISDNYQNLVINIFTLIVCVFLQLFLFKYSKKKLFITAGGLITSIGLITIYSYASPLFAPIFIFGYAFMINPLWEKSLKLKIAKELTFIIIIMSFVFGYALNILTTLMEIDFLSLDLIWISIITLIIVIYLINWVYKDNSQSNSRNKNKIFLDKYRFSLSISHSIALGIIFFILSIMIGIGSFPLNLFFMETSLIVAEIIFFMGIMVIFSMIYSNFQKNTLKNKKWIVYPSIILNLVIVIGFLIITIVSSPFTAYILSLILNSSIICFLMLFIIQKDLNYIWLMPVSLIVMFGGQLTLILFPNSMIIFLIYSIAWAILNIWNRNTILEFIPLLDELEEEREQK